MTCAGPPRQQGAGLGIQTQGHVRSAWLHWAHGEPPSTGNDHNSLPGLYLILINTLQLRKQTERLNDVCKVALLRKWEESQIQT